MDRKNWLLQDGSWGRKGLLKVGEWGSSDVEGEERGLVDWRGGRKRAARMERGKKDGC